MYLILRWDLRCFYNVVSLGAFRSAPNKDAENYLLLIVRMGVIL